MICKKCGVEFEGGYQCPICGNNEFVDEYNVDNVCSSDNAISDNENLWCKFANVGYIIGLITFICSFVLPICVPTVAPIAGIVFSCLGKKSINNKAKAKKKV